MLRGPRGVTRKKLCFQPRRPVDNPVHNRSVDVDHPAGRRPAMVARAVRRFDQRQSSRLKALTIHYESSYRHK